MNRYQKLTEKYIAQSCVTYSKRADQFVKGVYPTHCGLGLDRNLDHLCALGANLIGHNHSMSLPTQLEPMLAERICKRFNIDKLKFLKTGSAACEAAIRISRAYSGKKRSFGVGYHGCSNVFIAAEVPGVGCIDEKYTKFESLHTLIRALKRLSANNTVAAVIIEPVMLDMHVYDALKTIRALCTAKKIVLIFDEILTNYRYLNYSVANHSGITPDLMCLGKALANGSALSIVGGKAEIMDTPDYFVSNTHNGEIIPLMSALNVHDNVTATNIRGMWKLGEMFQRDFNTFWPESIRLVGIPTRAVWRGDETVIAKLWQEALKMGYFNGKAWFTNMSHTESEYVQELNAYEDIIKRIKDGKVKLKGDLPKPIFKRV